MSQFKLFYPVKPLSVNQPFGVNPQTYAQFGLNGHNGLDLMAYHGQPVYAAHDGMAWYEVDNNQGHGVVLTTDTQFDYKETQAYFKTIYWHLCDYTKEPQFKSPIVAYTDLKNGGLSIKAGDLIGYADSTGFSTGSHLHFGCKPMALKYPSDYTNIEQQNGFLGAIDPTPYFNGQYAQDIGSNSPALPQNTPYRHSFTKNMVIGDDDAVTGGNEVLSLQKALSELGYFTVEPTGYYGPFTKAAVYAFQLKYITDLWGSIAVFFNRGDGVFSKTRAALNKIFA